MNPLRNLKVISVKNTGIHKPTGSVIFLHGSGDSGPGVQDWIRMLLGGDLSFPHLRVLFPTAPERPYTPNKGQISNVWFDRIRISPNVPDHVETIDNAGHLLKKIINDEINDGIPLERIVIGGFSMGGAMAMQMGYRFFPQVAGVFALSSFLNKDSIVYQELENRNQTLLLPPLLMFHGEKDPLSDMQWAVNTRERLTKLGVQTVFNSMPSTFHELKKNELTKLSEWILTRVPPPKSPDVV